MTQLLIYILLLLALVLPVLGAIALRIIGPRLTSMQLYGSAVGMFGVILLSVLLLVRSDAPGLQLGRLSVLLPVTSPGDVQIDLPVADLPIDAPPVEITAAPGGESVPTAASATELVAPTAAATQAATEQLVPTEPPTATPAPTAVPTATPAPTAVPEPTAPPAQPEQRKYTVQAGDTLRSIAEQFNVSVKALIDANKLTDAEADSLRVGQELIIP